jgi:NADH-quinone oxidoreductase subunit L
VVTHAFFKALLFLGAGSVILAMHHEQDTDRMGGLWRAIPVTHWTFLAGVLAIAGAPYLSGFFSKDEILLAAYLAHGVPGHAVLYAIGVLTAGLTAFYMFRLHFRTFLGPSRAPAELRARVHEPGRTVLVPLVVLAFLSIFGGYLGPSEAFVPVEDANSFGNFVAPVLHGAHHEASHATERGLAAVATAVALAGVGLAWLLYVRRPVLAARLRGALGPVHRAVADKYRVDEAYDALVVRPLVRLSDRVLYRAIDARAIDAGAVEGSGRAVRALARDVLRNVQSGLAQGYLVLMLVGTVAIVGWLLR